MSCRAFRLLRLLPLALLPAPLPASLLLTPDYDTIRVIEGAVPSLTRALTVTNTGDTNIPYVLTFPGFTSVNDLGLGTANANLSHLISGTVDLTGVTYGTTLTPTWTLDPTGPGETVSESFNLQVIRNRALTGTSVIDAGRFMVTQQVGSLIVSGGSDTDNQATRVTLQRGSITYGSGGLSTQVGGFSSSYFINDATINGQGLRLTYDSPSNFQFNTSGQTATLGIDFTSTGAKDVTLTGAQLRRHFFGEFLTGAQLDTSALSVQVTGTALNDRLFYLRPDAGVPEDGDEFFQNDRIIDLGRRMKNDGASYTYAGSETLTLSSPTLFSSFSQSDDHATRVQVNAGSTTQDGLTLEALDTVLFANDSTSTELAFSYNITFDGATRGTQIKTVDANQLMASGETGGLLPGQSLTSAQAGVSLSVLEDRVITATDVTVRALAGSILTSAANSLTSTGHDSEFTRVTVTTEAGGTVTLDGTNSILDVYQFPEQVQRFSGGARELVGTQTIFGSAFQGEGLAGENVQNGLTYDVYTQFYDKATVIQTGGPGPGSTLGVGSTVTFMNTAGEFGADAAMELSLVGDVPQFSTPGLFYEREGGLNPGQSASFTIRFTPNGPLINALGGTYTGTISATFSNDLSLVGAEQGDLGNFSWNISHTIARPTANSGQATIGAGQRIGGLGITYANSSFSTPTQADLLDSNPLSRDRTIDITFADPGSLGGLDEEFLAGDIAVITGLDGELFVLQLSYDEAYAIANFGFESAMTLTWFDPDTNRWVNAVLGNSDNGAGARRFGMGYAEYLNLEDFGGLPQLSHFGIDTEANVVWAVLDHNSAFGPSAIPEPSTYALIGLGLAALIALRRKGKAEIGKAES